MTPNNSLLSILLACYNRAAFIPAAVASAVEQTYKNVEIVALDDGSTDETWAVLQELAKKHSSLKIYQNDANRGVGYTKRRLIELSTGELFGYLDPDDILLPTAAEVMVAAHRKHPECSTINSIEEHCDENLNPIGRYTGKPMEPGRTLLAKGGSLSHFCTFKRAMYDKAASADPFFRRAADIDLYLRMEEVGPIGFVPEILYRYRRHAGGVSQGQNQQKAFLWYILARYEACKRRGVDPESLLLPELRREFGQIGLRGAARESLRVTAEYTKGKLRGLRNRLRGARRAARGVRR